MEVDGTDFHASFQKFVRGAAWLENIKGAGIDGECTRLHMRSGIFFDDTRAEAPSLQLDRCRQADRARADNQDIFAAFRQLVALDK